MVWKALWQYKRVGSGRTNLVYFRSVGTTKWVVHLKLTFTVHPLMVMLVALVTQCVYAWRIWLLSQTIWVPVVVTVVGVLLYMA